MGPHAVGLGQPELAALPLDGVDGFGDADAPDDAAAGATGAATAGAAPSLLGAAPDEAWPPSAVVATGPAPALPSVVAAGVTTGLLDAWTLSRWSFLAQPEPLNTMAGVETILRIGDPQRSQLLGPSAVNECMISTGWPHTVHTYS